MTHLTFENMNGTLRHLRGLSGPIRVTIEHGADRTPMSGLGQEEDNYGLSPDWEYPRVQEPLKPGEFFTFRRDLEKGETWKSDELEPAKPLTPSNDERNLPDSLTQQPIKQLPHIDYSTNFPHGWIDYENLKPAIEPDRPPVPMGWGRGPRLRDEKRSAVDLVAPQPWVPEEMQTYDISGFGSLQELNSFALIAETEAAPTAQEVQAASGAVTAQVQQAKAAGATPAQQQSIFDYGTNMAALYLQKQAAKRQAELLKKAEAARQAALAAQARAAGAPPYVASQFEPKPSGIPAVAIGAGAVGLLAIIIAAMSRK